VTYKIKAGCFRPSWICRPLPSTEASQLFGFLMLLVAIKMKIGVTPMYESLMELCGISKYHVINAYNPSKEEMEWLKTLDVLIVTKGYTEKIQKYYTGKIIEIISVTFDDLVNSMQKLTEYGNKKLIAENIAKLLKLKETYREYAKSARC